MIARMTLGFIASLSIVQAAFGYSPLFAEERFVNIPENQGQGLSTEQHESELSKYWSLSLLNYLIDSRKSPEEKPEFDFSGGAPKHLTTYVHDLLFADLSESLCQNEPFHETELQQAKSSAYAYLQNLYEEIASRSSQVDLGFCSTVEFFQESILCLGNIALPDIHEALGIVHSSGSYAASYPVQEAFQVHNSLGWGSKDHLQLTNSPHLGTGQNGVFSTIHNNVQKAMSSDVPDNQKKENEVVSPPPETPVQDLFHTLPVADWEVEMIRKIINNLGEKNVIQLLIKKKEMKKMGKKINPVHPLRFLEVVFSNRRCCHAMRDVKKNSFKWDSFMEGLSERIDQEYSQNNLFPHLHGFCDALHVDYEAVSNLVAKREWKQLVSYLISAT